MRIQIFYIPMIKIKIVERQMVDNFSEIISRQYPRAIR